MQKTVVELKTRVRKLEKVRARDRKKIAKVRASVYDICMMKRW